MKSNEALKQIDWNYLGSPLYRANTPDGRKILIVRALKDTVLPTGDYEKRFAMWVFVEKGSGVQFDCHFCHMEPPKGGDWAEYSWHLRSEMAADMANDFVDQSGRVHRVDYLQMIMGADDALVKQDLELAKLAASKEPQEGHNSRTAYSRFFC